MNIQNQNWKNSEVKLADIYIGDPDIKIKDAVGNESSPNLLAAYSAVNRMLADSGWSSAFEADEIETMRLQKLYIENELTIRLRSHDIEGIK